MKERSPRGAPLSWTAQPQLHDGFEAKKHNLLRASLSQPQLHYGFNWKQTQLTQTFAEIHISKWFKNLEVL